VGLRFLAIATKAEENWGNERKGKKRGLVQEKTGEGCRGKKEKEEGKIKKDQTSSQLVWGRRGEEKDSLGNEEKRKSRNDNHQQQTIRTASKKWEVEKSPCDLVRRGEEQR